MKTYYPASSLLVTLIFAIGLFAILFLNKDRLLGREKLSQFYAQQYLTDKYQLIDKLDINHDNECQQQKKPTILFEFNIIKYSFHCEFSSLFDPFKPTKEKYIQVDKIENWLNLSRYKDQIHYIKHLSELPPSSETDPKIVIALNEINEKLESHFYGIVITDYLFDITGKRMYGTLYSSYDNLREERNLSYKKEVIHQLESKYSFWRYLPHSRNILANE